MGRLSSLKESGQALKQSVASRVDRARERVGNDDDSIDQFDARLERAREEARQEARKSRRQERLEEAREQARETERDRLEREDRGVLDRMDEALSGLDEELADAGDGGGGFGGAPDDAIGIGGDPAGEDPFGNPFADQGDPAGGDPFGNPFADQGDPAGEDAFGDPFADQGDPFGEAGNEQDQLERMGFDEEDLF
jgi:hypothetical protein